MTNGEWRMANDERYGQAIVCARCRGGHPIMKLAPYLLVVVTAFAFPGCDSKEEKARKEALENKAKSLEDAAAKAKKDATRAAEADRIEGERKAAALKAEAERTRENK